MPTKAAARRDVSLAASGSRIIRGDASRPPRGRDS
jgi:hypothetical protein